MNKQLPLPIVVGAIAVVVILASVFAWKTMSAQSTFPRAPIKAGESAVPSYVKGLSPEQQKLIEEQMKKYPVEKGTGEAPKNQGAPK
jgi:hypothetical protein